MIRDSAGRLLSGFKENLNGFAWDWQEDYFYAEERLVAASGVLPVGHQRHYHSDHLGTPPAASCAARRRPTV